MDLKLEKISISYSDWEMENLSFFVKSGSFTSIVGPSGSGKTTLLRLIAGIEKQEEGKIFFGKKEVTLKPAEERNIGFVFQNDSLFSHLNVYENIAFGLKIKKEKNIFEKVKDTLAIVQLTGFEKRKVTELSGGEKKRVAIARALAFNPSILLLDEPLNGLDAKLKETMKVFLKKLQKKINLTMVMVTHDIDEAFFLSDSIIVMNNGKIEQKGNPIEIFSNPKSLFVKKFVSDYTLVEAKKKTKNGKTFFEGKFVVNAKSKGKMFVNFKKSNYKFI